MSITKLVFLLQLLVLNEVFAWRLIHRGRENGGMLGKPPKLQKTYGVVQEEWFTQTLDHFNPTDTRTWQQRYFVNSNFFNNSATPLVFLMIGGEGEATIDWMTEGTWIEYAKKLGALCFQVEHRYYGKSYPTEDMSLENLQYLTSEQALADLAQFISTQNAVLDLPPTVKWVSFGGSYSGSLSAWLRQKYSQLVDVSIATSAPLLAELDFENYFKVVDASLATSASGQQCVDNIHHAFDQVYSYLNEKNGHYLNEVFQLCDDINVVNSPKDIANFFTTLAGDFALIVQYNKDNRIGANPKVTATTIDTICEIMTNEALGSPIQRLAEFNSLLLNITDQTCTDYKYKTMIEQLRNVSWASAAAEGGRQWTYQTCVEFAFFQTSDYKPQVFGHSFPTLFSVDQCIDIFGSKFNESFIQNAVNRTNINYGALNTPVTRTVFVQGTIDPWHVLGINNATRAGSVAVRIEGGAHCSNMYPPRASDSPALIKARRIIFKLLKWFLERSF